MYVRQFSCVNPAQTHFHCNGWRHMKIVGQINGLLLQTLGLTPPMFILGIMILDPICFDYEFFACLNSWFLFVGLLNCNGLEEAALTEILPHLERAYCGQLSVEIQHIVVWKSNHRITMHNCTEWHISGRLKLSYILVEH